MSSLIPVQNLLRNVRDNTVQLPTVPPETLPPVTTPPSIAASAFSASSPVHDWFAFFGHQELQHTSDIKLPDTPAEGEDLKSLLEPLSDPEKERERNLAYGIRRVEPIGVSQKGPHLIICDASPYRCNSYKMGSRGTIEVQRPSDESILPSSHLAPADDFVINCGLPQIRLEGIEDYLQLVRRLGMSWRKRDKDILQAAVDNGLVITNENFLEFQASHPNWRFQEILLDEYSEAVPYLIFCDSRPLGLLKHFSEKSLNVMAFGTPVVLRDQLMALLHQRQALKSIGTHHFSHCSLSVTLGIVRPQVVGKDFLIRDFLTEEQLRMHAEDYMILRELCSSLNQKCPRFNIENPEISMVANLLQRADQYFQEGLIGWNIGKRLTEGGSVIEYVIYDPA